MRRVLSFPGVADADVARVGGKALSLLRLAAAGLDVPPGAVLTTDVFRPWVDALTQSAAWAELRRAESQDWPVRCAELRELARGLAWTEAQRADLTALRALLGDDALCAVRSSSPDEDLVAASFAGGYETRLGVRGSELEPAIRACFCSALEARVLTYKRDRGLDPFSLGMAVIVQRQLASRVSGVGFSVNPLTNDQDEAVVDASWGLGEPIVAGRVTPDHWVVDKISGEVLEEVPGSKQTALRVAAGGGTVESEPDADAARRPSLTTAELSELTEMIGRVETLFGAPVDVEWAFEQSTLWILQARPVTTCVPLPEQLQTAPGERRRLYVDVGLSSGFTIDAPVSPMGLGVARQWLGEALRMLFGRSWERFTRDDAYLFCAGGRIYCDVSNMLWLAGPRRLAKSLEISDALTAQILGAIDERRYRAPRRPAWARPGMLLHLPRVLWSFRRALWNTGCALIVPGRFWRRYCERIEAYESRLARAEDESLSADAYRCRYAAVTMRHFWETSGPALIPAVVAQSVIRWIVRGRSEEERELGDRVQRGFSGNLVVQMGVAIADLAARLEPAEVEDLESLARRVEAREMPERFLEAWDRFIERFGGRGPGEMDIACPRYGDDPRLALRQIGPLVGARPGRGPAELQQAQVAARERAFDELCSRLGPLRRWLLRWAYRRIDRFGGERDTPKHHILMYLNGVRRRLLQDGERLVDAGRLARREHVFDVTLEDLTAAAADPDLDLQARRADRTRFLELLRRQVRHFPPVIDSRGRILRRPPRAERPGELVGIPISPGTVRGRARVLTRHDEKPVQAGEILVAYTTDPGWTPLFASAEAILLEIGGVLQHGAIVAREYGKPCVAGIERLTSKLRDGQRIEVDGGAGLVRLLEEGRDGTSPPRSPGGGAGR